MLIVLCTVLSALITFSVLVTILARKLFLKCAEQHERLSTIMDVTDNALDVLDSCYKKLVRISSTPVLFDSPEIREVCATLIEARDAVANVAKNITSVVVEEDENGDTN